MPQICIVGRDWKFRALVRAELREQGYEALGMETLDEVGQSLACGEVSPAALVFDLSESDDPDRDIDTLRLLARALPVLLIASHSNAPALATAPEGITLLFRPLAIADVVNRIHTLLAKR